MYYLDVSTSRTCNLHRHSPCGIKTRVAKRTRQTISLHFIARLSFHPSLITVNIFIGVPCPLSLEFYRYYGKTGPMAIRRLGYPDLLIATFRVGSTRTKE